MRVMFIMYHISTLLNIVSSVMDPDPYVSLPTGSGSVIICTDPDPSINKQKKKKKTLISSTYIANSF
jgi:hypothetical protein